MKKISSFLYAALLCSILSSCCCREKDPMPSWNDTGIKKSILEFVGKAVDSIPVEDRIAVFDMDGTIACETPLWFEMYAAVNGLNGQSKKDPGLMKFPEYQYARKLAVNPEDTSVTNHWAFPVDYIDSMVWKSYAGTDNEAYVDSARAYLARTKNRKFNIPLSQMFYQPMLELITYLKKKKFEVYVVSGSIQGVIWSVCPQVIAAERSHLIGTDQLLTPVYRPSLKKTMFVIGKGIFTPKDDNDGKSENIYSHIGRVPVFAFGNTTGDFGMFHLTSTSKYPHAVYLLNHDDGMREYEYLPWHGKACPAWKDSLRLNHWNLVNMAGEFKTVWMEKSK